MSNDAIQISIDEDGTITVQTEAISLPNHRQADELIKLLMTLAGGSVHSIKHPQTHQQGHSHAQDHDRLTH